MGELKGSGLDSVEVVVDGQCVGKGGNAANTLGCPEIARGFEDPSRGRVCDRVGAVVPKRALTRLGYDQAQHRAHFESGNGSA